MSLKELILNHRSQVTTRWYHRLVEEIPAEAKKKILGTSDRFSNPIGFALSEGTQDIFDCFFNERPNADLEKALDKIVKIKAIQAITPSEAVHFVFLLKEVLLEVLEGAIKASEALEEWLEIEREIDRLVLIVFDLYSKAREKLYEIKVNEMKAKTHMLRRISGDIS